MAIQSKGTGGRTSARRRSRGLWAGAGLALAVVVMVGFFGVRGWLAAGPRKAEAIDIPARDITSLPLDGATGPEGATGGARGIDVQLEDALDPKRLKGELHAAELEPKEGHRYIVKEPEAWLYLKNGWMLYVRGDTGNFYIPDDQKQPERGVLQGQVRCEGYAPRANGRGVTRGTLVRGTDKPGLVATTASMTFDSTLGLLSTDDRVVVTSDQGDFAGTGLKVVVNQVKEQLNALDVVKGESLTFRRKEKREAAKSAAPAPGAAAGGAKPAGGDAPGPQPAPVAPVISMYAAQFAGGVVVSGGGRTAAADRLEVWARLIDNALAPGAIVGVPVAAAPPAPAAQGPGIVRTVAWRQDGPAADGAGAKKVDATSEITLAWTGALHVWPLEAAPAELKADDVFLRMTAEESGLVRLADPGREMTGQCRLLEYGATARRLVLSGLGPSSVRLAMKDYAAEAGRIELDLGLGVGHVPGPGEGRDTHSEQQVSWAEQADFEFLMEKDPQMGAERMAGMKSAAFRKGMLAVRDASVTGDFMRAEFAPAGDQKTALTHLAVRDTVRAKDGRARSLSCDEADVWFKPGADARQPDPTSLIASGHVIAKDGPSTLEAGTLNATLERGEHGAVDVTWAEMKGGAHFVQDDGVRPRIEADAAELTADPVKRVVDLVADEGGTAKVVRGGAVVTGPSIRLNGTANGAWVVGPGTFANGPDKRSAAGPVVTASWTKEMKFDDTLGVLEASGDVKADAAADAMSLDKIRAGRVRLEMTPGRAPSEGDQGAIGPAGSGAGDAGGLNVDPTGGNRKLIRARAEGTVREEAGGANASVESWRFVADRAAPGGRRPERVMYLEGPLILASEVDQTLDVDGNGRLLVADRRYFEGAGTDTSNSDDAGIGARLGQGSVGGSVFTWLGSMHLDRAGGVAHFLGRVRLNHRPQRDASLMELECEDLTAKVRQGAPGRGGDAKPGDGELESADAHGAVWGRSASRELIADRLIYDAGAGRAEASASEGNRVTVFDRIKAATMTAAHIVWDMRKDEIEIVDPGTVTAPK